MKAAYDYERLRALRKALRHPLRRVVERSTEHPDYPHFQDEHLECGHVLRKGRMSCRNGVWFWPEKRRCWKCPEEEAK